MELEPGTSGLGEVSYAKCEDVKSISEERLIARLGVVGEDSIFEMRQVLGYLLDI